MELPFGVETCQLLALNPFKGKMKKKKTGFYFQGEAFLLNIQHIHLAINKWNGAILFNLVTNAIHPKGDTNRFFQNRTREVN